MSTAHVPTLCRFQNRICVARILQGRFLLVMVGLILEHGRVDRFHN